MSLELFAVPAFLTDSSNCIVWVNREFAAAVGDPLADGLSSEDRFLPALLLGPYREHFPRGTTEVANCVGALSPEVEAGTLSLATRKLMSRVFELYRQELAGESGDHWDGTIVLRAKKGAAMRIVREHVIPLADAHGVRNGFHISVWAPAESSNVFALDDLSMRPTPVMLTTRQREIASLYASGLSSRTVALRTGISHRTARDHIEAVYSRLGIHSRTELQALLAGHR